MKERPTYNSVGLSVVAGLYQWPRRMGWSRFSGTVESDPASIPFEELGHAGEQGNDGFWWMGVGWPQEPTGGLREGQLRAGPSVYADSNPQELWPEDCLKVPMRKMGLPELEASRLVSTHA